MLSLRAIWNCILLLTLLHPATAFYDIIDGYEKKALEKRTIISADINKIRGGLLVKNQQQTTCALGVIDSRASFVAASCLDNVGANGQITKNSTLYEVYLDKGDGSNKGYRYTVSNIHIHPLYNPTSLINNIAIVEFNEEDENSFRNQIAVNRSEWTEISYVRRSVASMPNIRWSTPITKSPKLVDPPSMCFNASNVYKENQQSFLCTSLTGGSSRSKCPKFPYYVTYSAINSTIALSALYSHTAANNKDMCAKNVKAVHYYTYLYNYVGFAVDKLKRPVATIGSKKEVLVDKPSSFGMKSVDDANVAKISVFGGDFLKALGLDNKAKGKAPGVSIDDSDNDSAESSIAFTTTATTTEGSPTSSPSTQPISSLPDKVPASKGGLSKTQIIIIATVVPIASIIFLIVLFFLYKMWQKKNKQVDLDPQRDIIRVIPTDRQPIYSPPPVAASQFDHPPVYDNQNNFAVPTDTKVVI